VNTEKPAPVLIHYGQGTTLNSILDNDRGRLGREVRDWKGVRGGKGSQPKPGNGSQFATGDALVTSSLSREDRHGESDGIEQVSPAHTKKQKKKEKKNKTQNHQKKNKPKKKKN